VTIKNKTVKRFLRNKLAVVGLCLIAFCTLVALLAYALAPDNTPYCNQQIIEINSSKPNTSFSFLKIPKPNQAATNISFFNTLVNGKPESKKLAPINSYTLNGDSLMVQLYISEDTAVSKAYHLVNELGSKNINELITKKTFWLGTDKLGRDIFSRLILGTRVSLMVGLIAVIISVSIGLLLGMLAGYYGGWVDKCIMWLVNVVWSIPTLLLVFAFTLLLGKGQWQVFIAVGLTMWVNVSRLVRGQVLGIKEMQYIEAAKVLNLSNMRIMFLHILPNIVGVLMVIAAGNFATAIVLEAGLSFLGVGVQPPQPSWGLMIKENYNLIIANNPLVALVPGFAIMLLVLSINMVGNGLRDAMDVKG
jgi:ABC-type dipeptide/oligopeptide/nickel transport system permease subunit